LLVSCRGGVWSACLDRFASLCPLGCSWALCWGRLVLVCVVSVFCRCCFGCCLLSVGLSVCLSVSVCCCLLGIEFEKTVWSSLGKPYECVCVYLVTNSVVYGYNKQTEMYVYTYAYTNVLCMRGTEAQATSLVEEGAHICVDDRRRVGGKMMSVEVLRR